ncbi:hypothetical protein WA026_009043 [Henosepilachna vigintioctopunctata]|uniref:Cytochrome P450 n=1 Tax=Henosepilachna vigintioctopunctata TaxID=420089 RepID=A0AAW1UMI4_9CUCU
MEFITYIITIFSGFVLVLLWLRRRFSYWERRGVATISSSLLFRNMKEAILQKNSSSERVLYNYRKFKSLGCKHCGIYFLWKPIYIAMDTEVVKSIMQTDFQYFMSRGIYYDEKNDPLSAHLFSLAGNKWKLLRNKLSPFFTTGQMKMMFETMMISANALKEVLNKQIGNAVDIEDVLGRFATDIIGSCAFDLDCESLENPQSEYRIKSKRFFHRTFFENIKLLSSIVAPQILKTFKMKLTPDEVSEFFMRIVEDHVAYREKNNIFRKDLMQLLIQLKNNGKLVDDEKLPLENITEQENELTLKEIAAQFLSSLELDSKRRRQL